MGRMFVVRSFDAYRRCSILLLLAGCLTLIASLLPWLKDPLGQSYSAWMILVDTGWQFRVEALNYGVICLCSAIYAFLIAFLCSRPQRRFQHNQQRHIFSSFLSLGPLILFLFQFLLVDLSIMTTFANHLQQALLIQRHLGYKLAAPLVVLDPFALDLSTPWERLLLLIDLLGPGPLLLLTSSIMQIFTLRSLPTNALPTLISRRWRALSLLFTVCCLCLLSRAPLGFLCEYQARFLLAAGSYSSALQTLDTARAVLPILQQMAFYHRERGEALYALAPDQPGDDGLLYNAAIYRQQGADLDVYLQLLPLWRNHTASPWLRNELSMTLERLAENSRPLRGGFASRTANDAEALPWLHLLQEVDASNHYALYLLGQIQCDLHNYQACKAEMSLLLSLCEEPAIQSSAYTYLALSYTGQGNDLKARELLLKALQLDPAYRNNLAREELSGLR